jgi:putative inorganic carbon (HCO3(-)) transporter
MGLFITLLFVVLSLLSPADLWPSLVAYHFMAVVATVAALITFPVLAINSRIVTSTQMKLMFIYMMMVLLSWLPHGWLGGIRRPLSEFLPVALVYFFASIHMRSVPRLEITRAVLIGTALFIISRAIPNYHIAVATHQPMPYVLVHETAVGMEVRLQGLGVLGDPNMFGQFLLMLLPLLFISRRPEGMRAGYLIALPIAAVFGYAIFLTGSRGSVLGALVLGGLYFRQRYRTVGTVLAVLIGGAIVMFINASGQRDISVSGGVDRLSLWSDGIGQFKSSPIWGLGYRSFAENVGMTAHNTFLLCAVETGFAGLFVWMGVIVMAFAQLNYVTRQTGKSASGFLPVPGIQQWGEAVKKSLVVYLFTGYFLSDTYELLLYLVIGMGGAVFFAQMEPRHGEALPVYSKWHTMALRAAFGVLVLIYLSIRTRAL